MHCSYSESICFKMLPYCKHQFPLAWWRCNINICRFIWFHSICEHFTFKVINSKDPVLLTGQVKNGRSWVKENNQRTVHDNGIDNLPKLFRISRNFFIEWTRVPSTIFSTMFQKVIAIISPMKKRIFFTTKQILLLVFKLLLSNQIQAMTVSANEN